MPETTNKRRYRRPFPRHTLEQALILAHAIQDKNAGNPMNRLLLADAINTKPTSSEYRDLLSSSYKYGLTEGTEKAESIHLTDTGKTITRPLSEEHKREALKKAVLNPETFKKIYSYYDGNKLPAGSFFENAIETTFSVPREYTKDAVALLEKNGKYAGLIRDISGSPYVMLNEGTENFQTATDDEAGMSVKTTPQPEITEEPSTHDIQEKPRPIFIAHGKDTKPLEQLKKILSQFKIPYKIAVDEPNSGRPISQKVRELMQACGSAIFIFSSEGEKEEDKEIRDAPNSNVVFEMGAASVLYGDKLIIFKENALTLPSNFGDLGYITFEKDKLDAKSFDLMKELVALGFIKFVTA